MLDYLNRIIRAVCEGISLLYLAAVILTLYEIFSRYVLNSPTIWVHDLAILLTGIAFVFGGPYALQTDAHVRLDVIANLLPVQVQRGVDRLSRLLTGAFLVVLLFAAVGQAERALSIMETSGRAWDVPIPTILKTALAVGVAVFLVQAVLLILKPRGPRSGGPDPEERKVEPWA